MEALMSLGEDNGSGGVFRDMFSGTNREKSCLQHSLGSPTRKSGIEYTLKKLLQLNTNEEVFDALKTQTVDLNIIRIRDGFTQLYAKDTALIDKQELDEDLQHKVAFHTDEIQRTPPAQQDEMRAALSYYHETTWK
ncbi:hypothetical protein DY000_02022658 [Brassica cretica]|uniref:Uncharacterized protein n=1 Tax=Brassica cretica TaxID=69181 RepID=A0ABQ7EJP3_BRACR|nr:hypothetical protein DY000_02022658 [Brassica cretica]